MKRYARLLPLAFWIAGWVLLALVMGQGFLSVNSDTAGDRSFYAVGFVVLSMAWAVLFVWVTELIYGKD